ncbi:MAG: hypothetical protein WC789_14230 [Lentisphaeria bacterium]|jgi:hypothetical protein
MTIRQAIQLPRSLALLLLALAAAGSAATAAPILRGAVLQAGFVPPRSAETVAYLQFTVENPDPVAAEVTVQVEAEGVADAPVYSKTVRIGPRAALSDRFPVFTARSESYQVSLLQDGRRLDRTKALTKLDGSARLCLAILNDDPDFAGYSEIADPKRTKGLLAPVSFNLYKAAQAPESAAGYGAAVAVILARPRLDQLAAAQQQALRDFVHLGGTLLLADPETARALASSPLQDLLPAFPAATRLVEGTAGLRAGLGLPPSPTAGRDAHGDPLPPPRFTLLEPLPTPGTNPTTLAWDGRPAAWCRRAGLGHVLMLGFDPFKAGQADPPLAPPLWNHLLTHIPAGPPDGAGAGAMDALLQQLQGFRIPPVQVIRLILAAYLGTLAFLLLLAFRLRKHTAGWAAAGLTALLFTFAILAASRRLVSSQPPRGMTAVSVNVWEGADLGGLATGSLFSKSEARPTVAAPPEQEAFFYPLVRPTRTQAAATLSPPLRVSMGTDDRQRLDALAVAPLRPRIFRLRLAGTAGGGTPAAPELPVLRSDRDGCRLRPWTPPAALRPGQHSLLLLPAGSRRLALREGRLADAPRAAAGLVQADPTLTSVEAWLASLNLATPCVALLRPIPQERAALLELAPDAWSEYRYQIDLVPANLERAADSFLITPDLIRLEPGDTRTRLLHRDGAWQEAVLRAPKESYRFAARLPPELLPLRPATVRLRLDLANPGGNVAVTARLLSHNPRTPAAPGVFKDGEFSFSQPPAELLDPLTGRFLFELEMSQKAPLANPLDSERVNGWRILALDVSVRGEAAGNPATRTW